MGLAGLTLAWQRAHHVLAADALVSNVLLVVVVTVFLLVAVTYMLKWLRHQEAVAKEFHHPVKLSFFPTISISLILLSTTLVSVQPVVAEVVWLVGSALHLLLTLYVVNAWIHHEHFQIQHINPAWFIPAVGNVIVPIAGVPLGYVELSWLFFSVGILFWVVLLTINLYRMMFHNPMPEHLLPTLFILIAPPAVGYIAYMQLVGELDTFARILYYSGLFMMLLLLAQFPRFARLQFFLSWWAYSFPLAAMTIATMGYYQVTQVVAFRWLSAALLAGITLIILMLVWRTLMAIRKKGICLPES
jgi:tellurite resistance protein